MSIPSAAELDLDPWTGSAYPPRRWQGEALPLVIGAVRRGEFPVIQAVTGAGKAVVIARLALIAMARATSRGVAPCVVVSAPTQALVRQLALDVGAACGLGSVGVYYGAKKQPKKPVIVTCNPSLLPLASELQTLGRAPGLLICDECHRSESDQIKDALALLEQPTTPGGEPRVQPRLGLTATPFRADDERLSLWSSIVYRYTLADALTDRVLAPWDVVNWDGAGQDGADSRELTDRVCIDLIRERTAGPGIVSATSIADATAYALTLTEAGLPSAPIHSQLGAKEQVALLRDLRAGALRCLVHVSLLTEGVDLPWLRWLCLRRPVGSPVRFLQEIGRGLRTMDPVRFAEDVERFGTKTNCQILDPHDIFGALGIQHEATVGSGELEEQIAAEGTPRGARESEVPALPPAKAIDSATAWTRRLLLSLQAAGLAGVGEVAAGTWRTSHVTAPQRAAILGTDKRAGLARMTRYIPEPHKSAVKALCQPWVVDTLQRGAVADLLDVLNAVAAATADDRQTFARGGSVLKPWKWPAGLEVPAIGAGVLAGLPAEPAEPTQTFDWNDHRAPAASARRSA